MRNGFHYNLQRQYVREVSFESPDGALYFVDAAKIVPEINVSVNVNSGQLDKDVYESVLILKYDAQSPVKSGENGENADNNEPKEKRLLFIGHVVYAAVFTVKTTGEQQAEPSEKLIHELANIDIPILLFPFVRNIIAQITLEAGFNPLLINPIDFEASYTKYAEKTATD